MATQVLNAPTRREAVNSNRVQQQLKRARMAKAQGVALAIVKERSPIRRLELQLRLRIAGIHIQPNQMQYWILDPLKKLGKIRSIAGGWTTDPTRDQIMRSQNRVAKDATGRIRNWQDDVETTQTRDDIEDRFQQLLDL